jgi:hypothetical protein
MLLCSCCVAQVAYELANAVTGSGGGQAPILGGTPLGAAVGDYAGKGFGYGEWDGGIMVGLSQLECR